MIAHVALIVPMELHSECVCVRVCVCVCGVGMPVVLILTILPFAMVIPTRFCNFMKLFQILGFMEGIMR